MTDNSHRNVRSLLLGLGGQRNCPQMIAKKSTPVNLPQRRTALARPSKPHVKDKPALLVTMREFFRERKLPHGGVSGYAAFRSGKWKRTVGAFPATFPYQPHRYFMGHGWHGYGDLLGLAIVRRRPVTIMPFTKARALARTLNLTSTNDWRRYRGTARRPQNLPSNPQVAYAGKGWKGYPDFLGYTPVADFWPKQRYLRAWHQHQAQARKK